METAKLLPHTTCSVRLMAKADPMLLSTFLTSPLSQTSKPQHTDCVQMLLYLSAGKIFTVSKVKN